MTQTLFSIFCTNLIITPLMSLLDPGYFLGKIWKQRSLSKQLKNKEFVAMTQQELNQIFEGPDAAISIRFSNLIKWLLLASFFSFIMPIGTIIIFFFIFVENNIDKYLFMRRFKEPLRLHKSLCFQVSEFCEAAPFLFCIGNTYFGNAFTGKFHILDIICLVVTGIIFFIPIGSLWEYMCTSSDREDDSWKFENINQYQGSVKEQKFIDLEGFIDLE
jgi:hypothetical protein